MLVCCRSLVRQQTHEWQISHNSTSWRTPPAGVPFTIFAPYARSQRPSAHLAFGSGPHHCPGAALARQELFSAFTIQLNRLDNIRIASPDDSFEQVPHSFPRGLRELHNELQVRRSRPFSPGASAYWDAPSRSDSVCDLRPAQFAATSAQTHSHPPRQRISV